MRELIKRTTGPHARGPQGTGAPLKERLDAARMSARQVEAAAVEDLSSPVLEPSDEAAEPPFPEQGEIEAIVEAAKVKRGGTRAAPQQRHCLIVDDSRVIRKVSRKIVEDLGYIATEAENGEEALARCKSAMPDLVITDWNMPVMTGVEFVATLRKLPGSERAKVVFCTSNSGARDVHEGIAAGADDYIVKPFGESALKAKLALLAR